MRATAGAQRDIKTLLRNLPRYGDEFLMYVDGNWCEASDGDLRTLIDPAIGAPIARVAEGTTEDARRAILAARKAFDEGSWRNMSAAERAALLFRVAERIETYADEFAHIDTLNNGKPLRQTQCDAADAAGCFRHYAGLAAKPHGQSFDVTAPSQTFTLREPIGVCGQIIPWNYPLLMAAWKLAPALAAGNTCVLKPSELTPLSALRLATIFEELDFPRGVVNVVLGAGTVVGAELAQSERVDKIAFTGGAATGRSIVRASVGNLKKVTLELGGKSPNIVFADADFETAVDYALFGIYANAGQVFSAGSRLVVQESIAERFVARLAERANKIRLGDGFDPRTEMGPIISRLHLERVERFLHSGRDEGAVVLCGGGRLGGALASGNFLAPTIFDRCAPSMRIVREEIFGPVLVVQRFKDEAEAISIADDTIHGLAGAVFTQDVAKAHRVIRKLRAPWGGYKHSGIGRELGTYGYDAYTEIKQINVNLDVAPSGWFSE
jgi:betaine-aldehyde dehydrogenase